LKKKSI